MTRISKPVTVDGYRSNTGAPHSWWNETGIFVEEGELIEFDTTGNQGTNNPGFGPSFGPEGDIYRNQISIDNRNWNDALAYVYGGQRCAFGSLIGKIGFDGDAFCIDVHNSGCDPLSDKEACITAPRTGMLFLAFNDGVNFEDNDQNGSWDLEVTFEEKVQLTPTGYGSWEIYADRVNTSLVDEWGVILTVEYLQNGTNLQWTPIAIENVVEALMTIRARINAQTNRTFKELYAGVELRLAANFAGPGIVDNFIPNVVRFGNETTDSTPPVREDNRSRGQISPTNAPDYYYLSAPPYGLFSEDDNGIRNTIIHELGHIIANRTKKVHADNSTSNSMYDVADYDRLSLKVMPGSGTLNPDASNDIGVYWENADPTLGELVPDNFLNWVRNSYVGIEGEIDTYNSSSTNPEHKRVWAYWIGGIQFTDPETQATSNSPGIQAFVDDAATFVEDNGIEDVLLSLGFETIYE